MNEVFQLLATGTVMTCIFCGFRRVILQFKRVLIVTTHSYSVSGTSNCITLSYVNGIFRLALDLSHT